MNDISTALVDELYRATPNSKDGHRINHAKGMLLHGIFTATPDAKKLSKAFHFQGSSVQILVRFSNSTGLFDIPDNIPQANPRGMAIRFIKDSVQFTDLIGHSVDAFPASTPNDFLSFLKVVSRSKNDPELMQKFAKAHPAAERFFEILVDKTPQSFATEQFFFLHSFKLINAEGKFHEVRFIIKPLAGVKHLTADEARQKSSEFLHDEMARRLQQQEIKFKLYAQLSQEPGRKNDVTSPWPSAWPIIDLGTLALQSFIKEPVMEDNLLFSPLNLTPGIEAGNDPMLQTRQKAYYESYQRRRGLDR